MFFLTDSTDSPLLELDIMAWRTLAQVAGDLPLPSPADMRRHNTEVLLHFMDDPGTRFDCDDGVSAVGRSRRGSLSEVFAGAVSAHRSPSLSWPARTTGNCIYVKWRSLELAGTRTRSKSSITL